MQKSLTQIFNETAAEAHRVFPQELNNFVLLATSTRSPVYVSPEIADHLSANTVAVRKAIKDATNYIHSHSAAGFAQSKACIAGTPVQLIALLKNPPGIFSRRDTRKMRAIYVLDHEIGHHILKNGHYYVTNDQNLSECAADAFAMLRHIQRFGKSTDYSGDAFGDRKAREIVLHADPGHYTADAVQRAKRVPEEMDISCLSLRETAELADKIAEETSIEYGTLKKMRDAFRPVNHACLTHIGDRMTVTEKFYQEDKDAYAIFCRETLAVMREHRNDPDIFKAGQRFFNLPPVKKFMLAGAETSPYWKNALAFIENSAKTPSKKRTKRPLQTSS